MEYVAGIAVGVVIILIVQTIIERRKPPGIDAAKLQHPSNRAEFIQAVDSSETGDRIVYRGDTYEITKWD